MKRKLKLKELTIQSFITEIDAGKLMSGLGKGEDPIPSEVDPSEPSNPDKTTPEECSTTCPTMDRNLCFSGPLCK